MNALHPTASRNSSNVPAVPSSAVLSLDLALDSEKGTRNAACPTILPGKVSMKRPASISMGTSISCDRWVAVLADWLSPSATSRRRRRVLRVVHRREEPNQSGYGCTSKCSERLCEAKRDRAEVDEDQPSVATPRRLLSAQSYVLDPCGIRPAALNVFENDVVPTRRTASKEEVA